MLLYNDVPPLQAPNIMATLRIRSSLQYITVYVAHEHIVIYRYMYLTSGKGHFVPYRTVK
jgi:hypothetical protein